MEATVKLSRLRRISPVDALRLNEDIQALRRIRKELDGIEPSNVSRHELAPEILKVLKVMTLACQRYAEIKLRNDYLKRF
jgi:hypothetical protein